MNGPGRPQGGALARARRGHLTAQEVTTGRASVAHRAAALAEEVRQVAAHLEGAQGHGWPAMTAGLLVARARLAALSREAEEVSAWASALGLYSAG